MIAGAESGLLLVADAKTSARAWPEDVDHLKKLVRQWTGLDVPVRTLTPEEWELRRQEH